MKIEKEGLKRSVMGLYTFSLYSLVYRKTIDYLLETVIMMKGEDVFIFVHFSRLVVDEEVHHSFC